LARWRKVGNEAFAERCLNAIKARFCDISVYAKEVKTRFYPSLRSGSAN
jgi:hypothetical protein